MAYRSVWLGRVRLVCFASLALSASRVVSADEFRAEQIEFFEAKIRPVLAKNCFSCHSARAKRLEAGLRLDARELILEGGESGAAVVVGDPKNSRIVQALRWEKGLEMPPRGKLSSRDVEAITRWVEIGLPWPDEEVPTLAKAKVPATESEWAATRNAHWAWRPVQRPKTPKSDGQGWAKNAIDRFALRGLQAAGLEPSKPAELRVLLRRIYFSLIGLPPKPEEIAAFVAHAEGDRNLAIKRVVDRLLDSPQYGERWARHWLDVARYSDGFGGFNDNRARPGAWLYRDWVVEQLNADLPFDRFVKYQIAGDLVDPTLAVATGFLALGPSYNSDGGDPDSVAQARAETLDDRVDTLSRGLLALTVSCSRCHDHKFDPVPQADYYSLAGVFNNTNQRDWPAATPEEVKRYDEHQNRIREEDKQLKELRQRIKKEKRDANDVEKTQLASFESKLKSLRESSPPKYEQSHGLSDRGNSDMPIAIRGNPRKPGAVVPRRFLRLLAGADPKKFANGSGRMELAEAVVDDQNPLTARVFVNRVWMHHFGHALVRSPSNFGKLGEKPSHPELLDWLAAEFMDSGWSLKHLHRLILTSAVYQMSSEHDDRAFALDGDNRRLWRANPRRLDAESWRDALLSVTGELDVKTGGAPVDSPASRRRTLYFKVSRHGDRFGTDLFLRLFDFPLMRATVASRVTSIVPQQYLFLMNSPFMIDRARAFAKRLEAEAKDTPSRVDRAYRLLYGRAPSAEEAGLAEDFLKRPAASAQNNAEAKPSSVSNWVQYCQVLLCSNEFMFLR